LITQGKVAEISKSVFLCMEATWTSKEKRKVREGKRLQKDKKRLITLAGR